MSSQTPFLSNKETLKVPLEKSRKWTQYLAALISAFASFGFGASLSWSSPVGHQLQGENEYFTLSSAEFGWIASIVNIGCIISALMISYSMDRFGRKKTMLLLVVPIMLGWILIIWAQNFPMMLIGRLLCGFAGAYCMIGPQYTSEIAEKEIRGIMGAFKHLLLVNGILFSYIIGPFTNIFWLSVICASLPLIFAAAFLFMPESPYFLIVNGKKNEAIIALKWLRGPDYDVSGEIDEIVAEIERHKNEKVSFKEELSKRATIRGIFIAYGLMFFFNMSGVRIVVFYTKDIFEAANTKLSSDVSSIIVGAAKVISIFITEFFIDKWGRKILLILSSISMTICLFLLGLFYVLKDINVDYVEHLGWLPVTSLSVYTFTFAFGMGAIPWVLISEVFSYNVKSVVIPGALAFFYIISFIMINTFGMLTDAIGVGETFWMFALITAAGVVFEYFIIPETKGKSLAEIQKILSGKEG